MTCCQQKLAHHNQKFRYGIIEWLTYKSTGYIMGHRMADLRDQGLAGPPTYNLTNNNGALVGFRRGSSPLLAEMLDGKSDEEDHSPPGGNKVGPYRGRLHNRKDRGPETHKPYPSTALVGPLSIRRELVTEADSEQHRNHRSAKSNAPCPSFTSTGIFH